MSDASQEIRPFRIEIPQADLDDLADRLARTRWANELPLDTSRPQTRPGPPGLGVRRPRRLRTGTWSTTGSTSTTGAPGRPGSTSTRSSPPTIDGQNIHFVHVRSPEPDALPLILTHGWPNTFLEYLDLVGPLTDPRGHGGEATDAFHVVIPVAARLRLLRAHHRAGLGRRIGPPGPGPSSWAGSATTATAPTATTPAPSSPPSRDASTPTMSSGSTSTSCSPSPPATRPSSRA